jgi:plasmid stabilization system protein ParE
MAFLVRFTANAKRDLDTLLSWLLSQQTGDTGLRWFQGFQEAIASLSDLPARCPLAAEDAAFPFEVRQLLYGSRQNRYRVLFTIDGKTVSVLHIRHGRRKPLAFH